MEYIIAKSTRDELEGVVNDMLSKGFKLYGPPFSADIKFRAGGSGEFEPIICQAMTRTSKEDPNE